MAEEELTIEDLELALELYELESEQKLAKLEKLFDQPLDFNTVFYEERSSLEVKFQNIVADLKQFLIQQQIASTQKLRKTFFRMLQNPLLSLFKVSRFEIFDLRLNAFDIQLQPVEALSQLTASLLESTKQYVPYTASTYTTYKQFCQQAQRNWIADQIFLFYSYLRKGKEVLARKFESKLAVVEMYANIEGALLEALLVSKDAKLLKELSILNFQLYSLEHTYDVMCFYMKVPLHQHFKEVFKEVEVLAHKHAYDLFILIFVRYPKEVLAKLKGEGVQFPHYIEAILHTLLQYWGLGLCLFKQFFDLFTLLFELHPDRHRVLLLCLTPLPTEDLSQLRSKYKVHVGHSQQLALLRTLSCQQVDAALNNFFHAQVYSMPLAPLSADQINKLFELLDSGLPRFLAAVEAAFKTWNHTIDFAHPQKYIQSQFRKGGDLALINNLCVLALKNFSSEVKNLQRYLIGLLLHYEQAVPAVWLDFLANCPCREWQAIILKVVLAPHPFNSEQLMNIVKGNFQAFQIAPCFKIMPKLATPKQWVALFMNATKPINDNAALFSLFGKALPPNLTKKQHDFLKDNAILLDEVLVPKHNGCFKLTQLEVTTNSIHFQRVLDNYYFTLDRNGKRFVQFLATQWTAYAYHQGENQDKVKGERTPPVKLQRSPPAIPHSKSPSAIPLSKSPSAVPPSKSPSAVPLSKNPSSVSKSPSKNITPAAPHPDLAFLNLLMEALVEEYPICVALLCGTRVQPPNGPSLRFVEGLAQLAPKQLKHILSCRVIKCLNGEDYVREEVAPIALKQLIAKVNAGSVRSEYYVALAGALAACNLQGVKNEILVRALQKVGLALAHAPQSNVQQLDAAYEELLGVFFKKKELDLNKKGLMKQAKELKWQEVRNGLTARRAPSIDAPITQHILISPFAVSPDGPLEAEPLDKVTLFITDPLAKQKADAPAPPPPLSCLSQSQSAPAQAARDVDLKALPYNLEAHFGKEALQQVCAKENIRLLLRDSIVQQPADQNHSVVLFYLQQYGAPQIDQVQACLLAMLQGKMPFLHLWTNPDNTKKLFVCLMALIAAVQVPKEDSTHPIVKLFHADKQAVLLAVLRILGEVGYTNLYGEELGNSQLARQLRVKLPIKEACFALLLRSLLPKVQLHQSLDKLLGAIFESRPSQQSALVYKVALDHTLLNLIMKQLSLNNLKRVSLLFHSNGNNLRLYTDQLHQGLRALNIASKNRSYNQFVLLAKDVTDEEFFTPVRLFKDNFTFFIRIEREGYEFKRGEEVRLSMERLVGAIRMNAPIAQVTNIVQAYLSQMEKLRLNIANRVKSFYLVAKLRELSYQNALTIAALQQLGQPLSLIKTVEFFSLLNTLYEDLVQFGSAPLQVDRYLAQQQVAICTTRRFAHAMSAVYEQCEVQFDQVLQRCFHVLKYFLTSPTGQKWLNDGLRLAPSFLAKNLVSFEAAQLAKRAIRTSLLHTQPFNPDPNTPTLSFFRDCPKRCLYNPQLVIPAQKQVVLLVKWFKQLKERLIASETLVATVVKGKTSLSFNKYKASQATMEEVELLGYAVGFHLLHGLQMDLALQAALIHAINFNVCDLDDLIEVDFKSWEHLKNVLAASDSKDLALTFSYVVESPQTLKEEKVQLLEKGLTKKVNNQNREDFVDLVCCRVLFGTKKHLRRFMESIIYVCPKEVLTCMRPSSIFALFYPSEQLCKETVNKLMRKIGVVLPEFIFRNGKRIDNLKDFQNVQWTVELLLEMGEEQRKAIWPSESNLFLVTTLGQKGSLTRLGPNLFLIEHFTSKEELKKHLL